MNYAILYSKLLLMPFDKALELFEDYKEKYDFKVFAEQQRILDILTEKKMVIDGLRDDIIQDAAIAYTFMSLGKSQIADEAFRKMKEYPMIVWIEALRFLDDESIISLLDNYHQELKSSLVEVFIVNLNEKFQKEVLSKYINELDKEDAYFYNFSYALAPAAREKLKEHNADILKDDILLEAKDMPEEKAVEYLVKNKQLLLELDADEVIEMILLKVRNVKNLTLVIEELSEIIESGSDLKFEFFLTRYKYLACNNYNSWKSYLEEEENNYNNNKNKVLDDLELFRIFKKKFKSLGVPKTLSLFNHSSYSYGVNEFTIEVIYSLLDVAYADCDISDYLNEATYRELINGFANKCQNKMYSLEEFEELVKKIEIGGRAKLIFDDYIEAIVACGKLLTKKVIDDKNDLFMELREKFTFDLINRIEKDGTYNELISLNGIFYRLAKGNVAFDIIYMAQKYKELIYLTKCGPAVDNAAYLTNFLTDYQLAKLDISPANKWRKMLIKEYSDEQDLALMERLGLQFLCYFGKDKAKYLLDLKLQGNYMENVFDGLDYNAVSINDDGTPEVNEELLEFLFGHGSIRETNSVINKMLRNELPEFKNKFMDFCNNYFEVKKACQGVLSVKRIVNYFNEVEFPFKLNPDELEFKKGLCEINTISESKLREAISLCKDARKREYSTIPKVEGELGDFRYEILDLDDPLAVAVGNLSHCCFVIGGISYASLKHSMQSVNGRTFVVYYKDKFLTQSWVWRNGDVICFDSVEAGCPIHGLLSGNIKLVDVYKKAAEEIMFESYNNEDKIQRVKVVTIGRSDYSFENLESYSGEVPKPLENNLYISDSRYQKVLAGEVPDKIRYGEVGAHYYDNRDKPLIISDKSMNDTDMLDEAFLKINSLRYQVYNIEDSILFSDYWKCYVGDNWYILVDESGKIESGMTKSDKETEEEYNRYLSKAKNSVDSNKKFIKTFGVN